MAERFKFNDEEENIDENDNQQDDLEKEYRNVMDKFFNPHKYSEQLSKYFENM